MLRVVWFLLALALVQVSFLVAPPWAAAASGTAPSLETSPQPRCPSKCGDLDIPYPFGVDDDVNCSRHGQELFTVTCNHTFSTPRTYWYDTEVISISAETSEMRVSTPVSYICYNSSDTIEAATWALDLAPFLISSTRNVFTAIGCNTLALLKGREDLSYFTGCITGCPSLEAAAQDGDACTGIGCCQTAGIPGNLSYIAVDWNINGTAPNSAWNYSPCSYGFVVEKEK